MTDQIIKPFITPVNANNKDVIEILEDWLKEARSGKLVSVGLVGKRIGGEWQTGMSASSNRLEDAAMLLELTIRRLGFTN